MLHVGKHAIKRIRTNMMLATWTTSSTYRTHVTIVLDPTVQDYQFQPMHMIRLTPWSMSGTMLQCRQSQTKETFQCTVSQSDMMPLRVHQFTKDA